MIIAFVQSENANLVCELNTSVGMREQFAPYIVCHHSLKSSICCSGLTKLPFCLYTASSKLQHSFTFCYFLATICTVRLMKQVVFSILIFKEIIKQHFIS
jgi:hypothetical protein